MAKHRKRTGSELALRFNKRAREIAKLSGSRLPRRRREGPNTGKKRSWVKERKGKFTLSDFTKFISKKYGSKPLPKSHGLKTAPVTTRAAWLADAFKRSEAKFFSPELVQKVVIPTTLQNPKKFAEGLGKSAQWFFTGLGMEAESFFKRLCEEGKLKDFVSRIYLKDSFAHCNSRSLGLGLENIEAFFEAMGEKGFTHFVKKLEKYEKTGTFLSGLRANLGKESERYIFASQWVKQAKETDLKK